MPALASEAGPKPSGAHLSVVPTYVPSVDVMRRLGICATTLGNWRRAGTGPRYVRFGRRIRYRLDDIEAFEAARTFASRAEETAASKTKLQQIGAH